MHTGSLALYDAPPSSSPRLFVGLTIGAIVVMAAVLGLASTVAPTTTPTEPSALTSTR